MSAAYPEPHDGGVSATDGWTGSDASHDRAISEQQTGRAIQRREQAISALADAGANGLTYRELGSLFGWHHGQSSGVLSVLHKERRIARLQDRRRRCHIYVLTHYIHGRETREAGRTRANRDCPEVDASELADRLTAASDEAYDRGWAAGHDRGWTDGTDAGWQTGYDAAMDRVGDIDERLQTALLDGRSDGAHNEAQRIQRLTIEMRRTIDGRKRANGVPTGHRPTKDCWIEHPACALLVIEKALALSLPPPQRREVAL